MKQHKTPLKMHPANGADRSRRSLIRRGARPLALEPRIMFDGAAVVDAIDTSVKVADASVVDSSVHLLQRVASDAAAVTSALVAAQTEAEHLVTDFLNRSDAKAQMFALFNGGQSGQPSAEWNAAFEQLMTSFKEGNSPVRVELRSSGELQGAKGAFSVSGTTGQATIYLNADWLAGNSAAEIAGADSASITTVLVEEIGHYLDARLNKGGDTPGDEGELFSRVASSPSLSLTSSLLDTLDDHGTLTLDGQAVAAEFASYTFVTAYQIVVDINDASHISGGIDTLQANPSSQTTPDQTYEYAIDKESNSHNFVYTSTGLGNVTVNDAANSREFSGNDVSAIGINIAGKDYYGWISRPIKVQGEVKAFYFWTDKDFANLAQAQTDGNQDGDASVLDNRGFILVVDKAYFDSLDYLSKSGVSANTYKNVGSSSDRVDTALNSLLPAIPATLTLANDTASSAAVELGSDSGAVDGVTYQGGSLVSGAGAYTLTATTNADGNVLANDTNGSNLSVMSISSTETGLAANSLTSGNYTLNSVGGIKGAYLVTGKYGQLTIDNSGNYSYSPLNSAVIVDALRTGTISETFTYTATDKYGSTATATLTVSVRGSNDAPVANTDFGTAKETDSVSNTSGFDATGNVLTNDTDVDTGDTKSIVGSVIVSSTPIAIAVTPGTTQLVFSSSSGNSLASASSNAEVFYQSGSNYYALADSSGKNVYVTGYTGSGATNYTFTFNANVAKYWDGTQFVTVSDLAAFFKTHTQILFKDTKTTNFVASETTTGGGKVGSALTSASSSYSDLTFAGNVSASYSLGMLLTGTNVPAGTTVLSVTYNGTNTVVRTTNELSGVTANISLLAFYGKTTQTGTYGTLTLYANGDYVYQSVDSSLTQGQVGTDTFTYTMLDAAGVQSRANLVITVYGSGANDPLLSDDSVAITEQGVTNGTNTSNAAAGTTTGNVLSNDKETATAPTAGTDYVTAIRNEASTATSTFGTNALKDLEASASVAGNYGAIVIKDDGSYTYTLSNSAGLVEALQSGVVVTDTFYYQVKNTLSPAGIAWAKLTITINGTNDIPTTVADTASVTEDGITTATGNVLTNDTDVDTGDTHAVTQATYSSTTATISAGVLSLAGQYGDLTLHADGSYTYTLRNSAANVQALTFGQQVQDTFTYTAQDSKGATATANLVVTVTGAEDRPIIGVTGVDVSEGADAVFKVDVSPSQASTVVIDLNLQSGTATTSDYGTTYWWNTDNGSSWTQVAGNQITLPANAGSFYVKVSTLQDGLYEGRESFVLNAAFHDPALKYQNGTGGSLRANAYSDGTATIYDDGTLTDDDRPIITVGGNNNDISEGSYAVFAVTVDKAVAVDTGIKLLLSDGTALIASDLSSTTMEVVTTPGAAIGAGTSISNGGTFTLPANTTTFYVRVRIQQDSSYEGAQDFRLTASFTAAELLYADRAGTNATVRTGASAYDMATILDDGTGVVYDGMGGTTGTPDNDRGSLSVTSIDVNEASPYAVFTVNGLAGHSVSLSLTNGTAIGGTGSPTDGSVDFHTGIEYYDGSSWTPYSSGTVSFPGGGTSLLVRVAIVNDTLFENSQTFTLNASDAGGPYNAAGLATIHDDGEGNLYPDNTTGATGTGTLDDDRSLSVSNVTVNEGSPYAVFTVTGAAGQKSTLSLSNGTTAGLTTLQVFDGSGWQAYTPGDLVALDGTGHLLVRAAIAPEQEATLDTGETFHLIATNTGATASTGGLGTVMDDGSGSYFAVDNTTASSNIPNGITLDDDRTLSVSNVTVNEGSPYAVFTVTGAASQKATLSLSNGTTAGLTTLQVFDGSGWQAYTPGDLVALDGTGHLLVRAAIAPEQEATLDTGETFHLIATNTGSAASTGGLGTVMDDGSGSYFAVDNTTASSNVPTGITLDDDRALSVSNVTVNEGSPYAVFTVTGAASQKATLSLSNGTTTGLTTLQVFDGSGWQNYTPGDLVALDGTGHLLVRAAIAPEQEATLDTGETFRLIATNTGATASTGGLGTVMDDGSGSYFAVDNTTASSNVPTGITLDDDRTLSVSNVTVNEGSPYAVFTVTGAASQKATLSLSNGTTTGLATLQVFDGSGWQAYTPGDLVALDGTGHLLVRAAIAPEQEATLDTGETFRLIATNTGATASTGGLGTVMDDGSGSYFAVDNLTTSSNVPTGVTLDDDRTLSVSNVTVNEGSPYAVFTVTGAAAQKSTLSLSNGTTTGLATLQVFDGSGWQAYTPGDLVALDGTGHLLVRAAIAPEQEATLDTGETFRLIATNTGATASTGGLGTVMDDGSGSYFAVDNTTASSNVPTGITLDDDRALSVSNVTVNEGSPYAVFTVTGAASQKATLSLSNGTTTGLATLQVFDGSGWQAYTPGDLVTLNGSGTLLVRAAIAPEQETTLDTGETFHLIATNTGATASTGGLGTVMDDGSGSYFAVDNTTASSNIPTGVTLDDDRTISVTGGDYNENSPRAIFTITAIPGQELNLSVEDAASPGKSATSGLASANLFYSVDGGATWAVYAGAITAGTRPVLVAVDITAERDNAFEGEEQLRLIVNAGTPTQASAYASIFDDKTGVVTDVIDQNTHHNAGADNGSDKDDDRPVPVVIPVPTAPSEAKPPSPVVIVSLPVAPAEPVAPVAPAFDATLASLANAIAMQTRSSNPLSAVVQDRAIEQATGYDRYLGEIYTSPTGFRVVVKEASYSALTLFRGVADQYADAGATSTFAVPYDAFTHTDPNERISLSANLSDGRNLPSWIQFDSNSGKFIFQAPSNFVGELKIKVTARDSKGDEVSTLFRFSLGQKRSGLEGRAGFSEQLKQPTRPIVTSHLLQHEVPMPLPRG